MSGTRTKNRRIEKKKLYTCLKDSGPSVLSRRTALDSKGVVWLKLVHNLNWNRIQFYFFEPEGRPTT